MSLQSKTDSAFRRIAGLPGIKSVLSRSSVRSTIQTWPFFRRFYASGWELQHPFDLHLGTDTSGYIGPDKLASSGYDSQKKHGYAGSQPSIIRSALAALPSLEGYSFIDLGCGKGRPLLVASEFPFHQLFGVELSPALADQARKNAAILKEKFPERAPIQIVVGDASVYAFPPGNLVVFLYNPFGEEVIARVTANIEAALATEMRSLFVVYYNPVFGTCFDASSSLTRYFAARLTYATEELSFGSDTDDNVVIWQGGGIAPAHAGADAQIQITDPGMRAELAVSDT